MTYGIDLGSGVSDFAVVRLRVQWAAAGVRVAGREGTITGCYFGDDADDHTVLLDGASGVRVEGNWFDPIGSIPAPNTRDNVHLVAASRCAVRDNHFAPLSRTRYGINVSDAASTENVVVGNYMRGTGAFGTAAINDAGTGTFTSYPAAAPPVGDNWV